MNEYLLLSKLFGCISDHLPLMSQLSQLNEPANYNSSLIVLSSNGLKLFSCLKNHNSLSEFGQSTLLNFKFVVNLKFFYLSSFSLPFNHEVFEFINGLLSTLSILDGLELLSFIFKGPQEQSLLLPNFHSLIQMLNPSNFLDFLYTSDLSQRNLTSL